MDLMQAAVSRDLAVGHAQHIAAQSIARREVVHGRSVGGSEVLRRWRASCLFGHTGTTFSPAGLGWELHCEGSTTDIVLRLTSLILRSSR